MRYTGSTSSARGRGSGSRGGGSKATQSGMDVVGASLYLLGQRERPSMLLSQVWSPFILDLHLCYLI